MYKYWLIVLCLSLGMNYVSAQHHGIPDGTVKVIDHKPVDAILPVSWDHAQVNSYILNNIYSPSFSIALVFDSVSYAPDDGRGRQHFDARTSWQIVDQSKCDELNSRPPTTLINYSSGVCFNLVTSSMVRPIVKDEMSSLLNTALESRKKDWDNVIQQALKRNNEELASFLLKDPNFLAAVIAAIKDQKVKKSTSTGIKK